MKLKKTIQIFSLSFLMMAFSSGIMAQCWILNASISGPENCVPVGSPVTYTGNNGNGSSGCTIHEWTVTGGAFIVNGVNVGTSLCLTETTSCLPYLSLSCSYTGFLSSGNTSLVTVVWASGDFTRSLKLKVKEKGKAITLTCTKEIDVSVTGSVLDITRVSGSCNSGTYTASLQSGCPPATEGIIQWFLNNSSTPFATGTTITYTPPLGFHGGFTLSARLVVGGVAGPLYSESFYATIPSITGPTYVNEGSFHSYTLNGGSGTSNVTWSLTPSLGQIVNSTQGHVDIQFAQVNSTQYGQLKATGSASNCPNWEYNLSILVNNTNFRGSDNNTLIIGDESRSTIEVPSFNVDKVFNAETFSVYPTVINSSTTSVLNIELPNSNTPYQAFIVDINGVVKWKSELSDNHQTVSVDFLGEGLYFLKIHGDNMEEVRKILVSR